MGTETDGKGEMLPLRHVAKVTQFWRQSQDTYLTEGAKRLL